MGRPRVTEADAVLDAAARRLASHGIADTTVDDVADEAGVSRATVYRYTGGKDEIVAAVIGRETEQILARLEVVIAAADAAGQLIAELVSTALGAIDESPVLARLSSTDLAGTLRFITVDSPPLVREIVSTLSPAIRSAPALTIDERVVEQVVEEVTRFVLLHLTTPRRDGSRLSPQEAGARAATLIGPSLEPAGDSR